MSKEKKSFEEANEQSQESLLSEVWWMLRANKRYWLIPLFAGLLLFGLLIVLGGGAAAPFIYTLF